MPLNRNAVSCFPATSCSTTSEQQHVLSACHSTPGHGSPQTTHWKCTRFSSFTISAGSRAIKRKHILFILILDRVKYFHHINLICLSKGPSEIQFVKAYLKIDTFLPPPLPPHEVMLVLCLHLSPIFLTFVGTHFLMVNSLKS